MNKKINVNSRQLRMLKSRSWKRWLFPIYALTIIFSELISYCYLILEDVDAESKIMQYIFVVLTGIAFLFLWKEISTKMPLRSWRVLFVLFIVPVLYWMTSASYDWLPDKYISYLLRYCSICISACIVGIYMTYHPCHYELDKLLPFFIIPIGLVLGSLCIDAMANMKIIKSDSGLNYQALSYGMAELYAYSCYYVFFSDIGKRTKLLRVVMFVMIFYFSVLCLVTGGRGAVVYLCFISLFIVWLLLKDSRTNKALVFMVMALILVAFIGVASYIDIWSTAGFARVAEKIIDTSNRIDIYDRAIDVFLDSHGFGFGLGSIWWTVGIYSHNVFLDLLAEVGIVGCLIVSSVFYLMIKRLLLLVYKDRSYLFILLCFLKTFVVTIFSSYWIASYQLWFAFGLVFSLKYYKVKKLYGNKNGYIWNLKK